MSQLAGTSLDKGDEQHEQHERQRDAVLAGIMLDQAACRPAALCMRMRAGDPPSPF